MKSQLIISSLIFIFVISSCSEKKSSSTVLIKPNKDTVEIAETFRAELSVPHLDSILPAFYIISKDKKFLLPFDKGIDCAIFQGESNKEGEQKFMGYVEFVDLQGQKRKESFLLRYYAKCKK